MGDKKGRKARKGDGKREYAASPDTATLETPDSTRSQTAVLKTAPADVALSQTNTPSAFTLDSDRGPVEAYAVTTQNETATEVTEVECPNGHAAGKGSAASGTVGKTATCSECGELLRPTRLVENSTGAGVKIGKDGKATLEAPKGAERAASEPDRGVTRAGAWLQREAEHKARKGTAKKATARKSKADKQEAAASA